jgi:hypothetical protein
MVMVDTPVRASRPVVAPRTTRTVAPERSVLVPWIDAQTINVDRHVAALRPFTREEFGDTAASPSEGHVQAVNSLLASLRAGLIRHAGYVKDAADNAISQPSTERLRRFLRDKERVHTWVQAIERIWDFYLELFGQRQSQPFADWLLSCDRIALDCYQHVYMGLGVAKSIPAPPPFAYMRTGFSPATFRRGIPLRRLGAQLNPFPLIQLPYHRLVNPWTLGAILHEVSHNFQSELGLSREVPRRIGLRLLQAGFSRSVAFTWVRWNRELFADVSGLLLGGPAVVGSLMDVVGRSPEATTAFNPRGVHPTPYFRTFISIELLRRMGFPEEAEQYRRVWARLYPRPAPGDGNLPAGLLKSFAEANALVVEAVCYQPYATLGNKSLAQVLRFSPKEQQMVEEAARRLAAGTDPGIVPERFLIGATRFALDHRLARPQVIVDNFYRELARR